ALPADSNSWIGFRLGIRGEFNDYRDSALYGTGLELGVTTAGTLFIGEPPGGRADSEHDLRALLLEEGLVLQVKASSENGGGRLTLSATDPVSGTILASVETQVDAGILSGGLALVSHFPEKMGEQNVPSCWFDDWSVSGSKIRMYPERAWGPILFSQYTLSRGTFRITAQLAPVSSEADGQTVNLQINPGTGWTTVEEAGIDPMARTATITVEDWVYQKDIPYRLVYKFRSTTGELRTVEQAGTVRKEPLEKEEVVIAALSCMNDLGFPHPDLTKALKTHDPDMLYFAGDQIYEAVAGYEYVREPLQEATLDYLRKWYLFGWVFRDLLRDRPSITIPDDHDVFQGNIWGAGGVATPPDLPWYLAQTYGGYIMPPAWVNMVQRTQTSHLPDPYDPRPIQRGIGVYFTEMNYAGISFAVLEDRKFKSGPGQIFPELFEDHVWRWNRDWEPEKADRPGAVLLGDRQLNFLEDWAQDWSHHAWIKVALSQTLFSTLHTRSLSDKTGTQERRVMRPGEYPPDDVPSLDFDADGWPQTGRNRAIRALRKGFALHLAGDQHLGSSVRYGVEDFKDSGYSFCVPAISNIWPRRWFPNEGGSNRAPGAPKYTGDFLDGLHNRVSVLAVANPLYTGREPADLYDRATGYGILRFHRKDRSITVECWPRFVQPEDPGALPFDGWPITLNVLDNYAKQPAAYLPELRVSGLEDPVVQVIHEGDNEVVYTLRIQGSKFRPMVFHQGTFTIRISDPDAGLFREVNGLKPGTAGRDSFLEVEF
ncbi:MAG: alkaline phosphatase D family protein, partial [Verrucomicrobiae bacterium]|nr:alkaline phosphatase D family protein [Verrucomicrobiae bacterium]